MTGKETEVTIVPGHVPERSSDLDSHEYPFTPREIGLFSYVCLRGSIDTRQRTRDVFCRPRIGL